MEQEIRERKVLSEELAKQVNALSAQKKELQALIKELREEMAQAQWDAEQAVAKAKETAATKIAEIEASVLPYTSLRSQVEATKQQFHLVKQTMETETQRLKHERYEVLKDINAKIDRATKRLASLADAERDYKAKVGAL